MIERHQTLTGPIHPTGALALEDCAAKFRAMAEGARPTFMPFEWGRMVAGVLCELRTEFVGAAEPPGTPMGPDETRALTEVLVSRFRGNVPRRAFQEAAALLLGGGDLPGVWREEFLAAYALPAGDGLVRFEEPWALDAGFRAHDPDDYAGAAYFSTFDVELVHPSGIVIEDDKTWADMPSRFDIPRNAQALVFALAALAKFPSAPSVEFRWNLIRHGYSIGWTFHRGEAWELEARSFLEAAWRQRETLLGLESIDRPDVWTPTAGDGCAGCPLMHGCPAIKELVDDGASPDLHAEEVARSYLAAKALAGELKRSIESTLRQQAIPVSITDKKVLGHKPTTRRVLRSGPEWACAELASTFPISFEEVTAEFLGASLTVKRVEAFVKSHAGADAAKLALDLLFEKEASSRLTVFRPSPWLDGEPAS